MPKTNNIVKKANKRVHLHASNRLKVLKSYEAPEKDLNSYAGFAKRWPGSGPDLRLGYYVCLVLSKNSRALKFLIKIWFEISRYVDNVMLTLSCRCLTNVATLVQH